MQDHSLNHRHGAKIAIPKLDSGPPPPPKLNARNKEDRVTRACKLCRKRKVRCSGHIPRCANCQTSDSQCVYEQARRDRLKESMELNASLITTLKDLSTRVNEDDKEIIRILLRDAQDDLISDTPAKSATSPGKRTREAAACDDEPDKGQSGEALVTASPERPAILAKIPRPNGYGVCTIKHIRARRTHMVSSMALLVRVGRPLMSELKPYTSGDGMRRLVLWYTSPMLHFTWTVTILK